MIGIIGRAIANCRQRYRVRQRRVVFLLCLALLTLQSPAVAQGVLPNPSYDGRPTFARLRYTPLRDPSGCQLADGTAGIGWGHDHPVSAKHMMRALTTVISLEAPVDSSVVVTADDPMLLRYPLAYVGEPGCWHPTEVEVQALRTYLQRGGLLIVDDFTLAVGDHSHTELSRDRFETWIRRVLPAGTPVAIPGSHLLFDGFFQVKPEEVPSYALQEPAEIYGIYEDNDPMKRLLVIANYKTNLGNMWRWVNTYGSGLGTNVGYRLGINFFIYGLSH